MKIHKRLLQEAVLHPKAFIATIAMGISAGLVGISQAWVFSWILDFAFLEQRTLASLLNFLALLLGLAVLRAGLVWGSDSAASALAANTKNGLRQRLLDHLIVLGPSTLRQERTGELTNTLTNGIEALDGYFSQVVPQIFFAVALPLAILIVVIPIDLISGIILLLTGPLIPFFMFLIGSSSTRLTRRQWKTLNRMSAYFLDVIQGLTTLKIFGRSKEQVERIARVSEQYRKTTMSVLRVTFLSALALELLSTLSTAVVAVQVGLRLLHGQIDFQPAFFILVLAPEYYLPLRIMGQRFHAGNAGASAAQSIYSLLDTPLPARSRQAFQDRSPFKLDPSAEIIFERVSFDYQVGRTTLQDVSFTILPNQITAIAGPSGSGKSTLADLLLGFIQPSSGAIRIGRQTLAEIPLDTWQTAIAWVPQKPHLFNDTIMANLRLGNPGASPETVRLAAIQAGADSFIQSLPQGYATPIGERGARLSSGQAQRIALARAFLKDASLVILDEPSSHLDPASEQAIAEATTRLAAERTVLIIAHRMHTLNKADQVVVIDQGKLIQYGSPGELSKQEGLFQRFVQAYTGQSELDISPEGQILHNDEASPSIGDRPDIPLPSSEPSINIGRLQAWSYLLQLLRPYGIPIGLSILLSFGALASSAGLMGSAAYIITKAALQPSIADLQIAIVGVRFFGLARGVLRYLERLVSHQATFLVLAKLRATFYQALEPLAPVRLIRKRSGDLLTRIVSDISTLEDFYVRGAAPLLTAGLTALAAGVFFSFFSTWMAAVILLLMMATGIGLHGLAVWWGKTSGKKMVQTRAELNTRLVDFIQGMADLQIFGQIGKQKNILLATASTQDQLQRSAGIQNAVLNAAGGFLAYLGLLCTLMFAIQQSEQGLLNPIAIGALALVALASFEPVLSLPQAARQLAAQLTSTQRLLEIIEEPDASIPKNDSRHEPYYPSKTNFCLEVNNLHFAYPSDNSGNTRAALKGVSFCLESGRLLAVIGPNGAGKSTLVNLLLRLWEYQIGSITLSGIDLHRFDPDVLRRSAAVLPQQVYLFNATIGSNLRLADPNASEDQLLEACHQAQLGQFIQSLPQGLDTWIGEDGVKLSAGERQRLALARALLKDAPLLILDEPGANLDTLTRQAFHQVLRQRRSEQAILMISHQLAGLEDADEILVLENGCPVEQGTYQTLLAQRGLFWRMRQIEQDLIFTPQ